MYLLDTNIVSYALEKKPEAKLYEDILTAGHPLFISVQNYAEMRFGALIRDWETRRVRALEDVLNLYRILAIDIEVAENYAKIACDFKQRGRALSAQDAWIAATAMTYDLTLVSHDRDFSGATDFRVIRMTT